MTWEPNKDGVKWFVETIYPKIKEKNPDVSFIVVGKHNGSFLSENEDISIKILGYVSDLDDIYENTDLFICPLRFGSGMKVKVLHAMYRGLPFVTTSVGAESIDLKSGEHCFIADTPDEFAEKTLTLLCDSNLWKKFSVNSRTLAEKLYTWETEYSRLDTSFKKLMSLRGTNPAVSET
jgi:glycosyltransferase involved in cell wall biosynthesis